MTASNFTRTPGMAEQALAILPPLALATYHNPVRPANRKQTYALATPANMDAFFRQVEHRAYRMVWYAIRDEESARDLVQDSMLKLVEKYSDKPAEEWAPLFYTILNRRMVDWQRRRKVERILGLVLPWRHNDAEDEEPFYPEVPDPAPNPEGRLSGRQTAVAIDSALASLPPRQRQAFILRDWEGLSVKETAIAMQCSEGSVKTHHFRALAKLRTLLAGFAPRNGDEEAGSSYNAKLDGREEDIHD
ncbi:RNA polymerase sigma factor [Thermithiobacillus plumbiphilus]|uniref:RNA polymerase sigma factor n=1 Tax=Thermithiobacillus plumbiphilus TaxID=1729899 RepID=A0ABU9DDN3_9PROT